MKEYRKPEMHFVSNAGGLSGDEITRLTDEELAEYLKSSGYYEAKKRYRVSTEFVLREIGGECVLLPVGEAQLLGNAVMIPNKTASFLLREFSTPSTAEDVVVHALEQYEGEERQIRDKVKQFIKESLEKQVLLEVE